MPLPTASPDLDLTRRILEMATTGVYRGSIFEALAPIATQRQIRQAIAHAKQFGLHSVRSLRDGELGTYYQVEPQKYASFQTAIAAAVPLMGMIWPRKWCRLPRPCGPC
jgi:hypothetical protein